MPHKLLTDYYWQTWFVIPALLLLAGGPPLVQVQVHLQVQAVMQSPARVRAQCSVQAVLQPHWLELMVAGPRPHCSG